MRLTLRVAALVAPLLLMSAMASCTPQPGSGKQPPWPAPQCWPGVDDHLDYSVQYTGPQNTKDNALDTGPPNCSQAIKNGFETVVRAPSQSSADAQCNKLDMIYGSVSLTPTQVGAPVDAWRCLNWWDV